ncbi:MAG: hypothetical protein ACO240_02240, partial [Burkholderiaceae bacterium]
HQNVLLYKIICGDKSDNIPSVVTYDKRMSNGKLRTFSITEKQAEKILAEVFESQNSRVMAHRKTLASIRGLIEKIPLPTSLALTEALNAVRPSGEGPASTTP